MPSLISPATLRRALSIARTLVTLGCLLGFVACRKSAPPPTGAFGQLEAGVDYTNQRIANVPWSVHVVRIARKDPSLALWSVHADSKAIGLATLSQMVQSIPAHEGRAVAGINGDFYQRDKAYAGDPRGLQVVGGQFLSAPIGGVGFWIDAEGQPHAGTISNAFRITWPGGASQPFGLNEERRNDRLVLYTQLMGANSKTPAGREFVLESATNTPLGGLPVDETIQVRVRSIRTAGATPIEPNTWVLSASPNLARALPAIEPGALLTLATATLPPIRGARTAISGGPVLVHQGQAQKIQTPKSESYEFSSMFERHPRSAVGWNQDYFFLTLVDGRQPKLSVGMTLEELGEYMARLGCDEAINLDGGGSATLWCAGALRNSPCDGRERPVANALTVIRLPAPNAKPTSPEPASRETP